MNTVFGPVSAARHAGYCSSASFQRDYAAFAQALPQVTQGLIRTKRERTLDDI